MMNDKIVVIGKVVASESNHIDIEYQAVSGLRTIRMPRALIERNERIGDGRIALLINIDNSEDGMLVGAHMGTGPHSPLHNSTDAMMIVEAMEHGEETSVRFPR